jgi:RluA family pseudouridine synthase
MRKTPGDFKRPPKRFWPKGLSILYEDRDIVIVDKAAGLLTVSNERVRENTAYYLLNAYVKKGNSKSKNRIFIVHRLDRDTSGVIVFAKTDKAKYFLQDEWHKFKKKYHAVVVGKMKQPKGLISSYLAENSIHKMYSVTDPSRGKLARTGYKVLRESQKYSLLEIDLLTGRKNQIRVHVADEGCPIAGDKKYGIKDKTVTRLALHAASIAFVHPFTKERMTVSAPVPPYFAFIMKR